METFYIIKHWKLRGIRKLTLKEDEYSIQNGILTLYSNIVDPKINPNIPPRIPIRFYYPDEWKRSEIIAIELVNLLRSEEANRLIKRAQKLLKKEIKIIEVH